MPVHRMLQRESIGGTILALEAVLEDIAITATRLDGDVAERVVGAVALAGQVARQMRRVAWPSPESRPAELWCSIKNLGW